MVAVSTDEHMQHNIKSPIESVKCQTRNVEIHATEEESGTIEGEEELVADEVEEVRPLPSPVLPDQATIDRHNIDHYPYRSWCRACVSGRGRALPHRRTNGKRQIPTLAFDYCFINRNGVYSREEWVNLKAEAKKRLMVSKS